MSDGGRDRRTLVDVTIVPSVAGLLAAAAAGAAWWLASGGAGMGEAMGGGAIAVAFLGSTGLIGALVPTASLVEVMVSAYVTKVALLLCAGAALARLPMEREAFAVAVVASAVAFLGAQLWRSSGRR